MSLALAAATVSVRSPVAVCGMTPVSPLVIADRLITLAKEADRAGYRDTASHLVNLVYSVLDEGSVMN